MNQKMGQDASFIFSIIQIFCKDIPIHWPS